MRAVSVVHMLLRRGDCHDNAHFPTVVIVASSTDSTGTILSLQLVLLGLYRLRLPASNQNSVPVSPTPVLCVAVLGLLALCIGRLVSALAAFSVPVDVTHLYFCTAPQFDASHKLPVPTLRTSYRYRYLSARFRSPVTRGNPDVYLDTHTIVVGCVQSRNLRGSLCVHSEYARLYTPHVSREKPQSTIKQSTQSIHTHSNGTTNPHVYMHFYQYCRLERP